MNIKNSCLTAPMNEWGFISHETLGALKMFTMNCKFHNPCDLSRWKVGAI